MRSIIHYVTMSRGRQKNTQNGSRKLIANEWNYTRFFIAAPCQFCIRYFSPSRILVMSLLKVVCAYGKFHQPPNGVCLSNVNEYLMSLLLPTPHTKHHACTYCESSLSFHSNHNLKSCATSIFIYRFVLTFVISL